MIAATTWASVEKGVFEGFRLLFAERWGIATLMDAYFAFFFFSAWVFYKEEANLKRGLWFLFIISFGNMAMAIYALKEMRRLGTGISWSEYLSSRNPS
jgi:hypothetical protein